MSKKEVPALPAPKPAESAAVVADQPVVLSKPVEGVTAEDVAELRRAIEVLRQENSALRIAKEEAPPKLQHAEPARSELNPEPETDKKIPKAVKRYEMSRGTICEDY